MKIPRTLIEDALYLSPTQALAEVPEELTVEQFSRLYVALFQEIEHEVGQDHEVTWVWDLMYHLSHEVPELALECVISATKEPLSNFQASCISAGALEDIIADHGPAVIDKVEALASKSARFRYMLSGVWPRGQDTSGEVWQRLVRARAAGPDMNQCAQIPPVDL